MAGKVIWGVRGQRRIPGGQSGGTRGDCPLHTSCLWHIVQRWRPWGLDKDIGLRKI